MNQPQAWLGFDPHGNLTHAFSADRGFVGGVVVPFFTLQGNQIFTAKVDEVVEFLSGLGLDRDQAMDVITSVGTAP